MSEHLAVSEREHTLSHDCWCKPRILKERIRLTSRESLVVLRQTAYDALPDGADDELYAIADRIVDAILDEVAALPHDSTPGEER